MRYLIADYLTTEQKARACRYYYINHGRTEDGYCPLGAALNPLVYKAPGVPEVVEALLAQTNHTWRARGELWLDAVAIRRAVSQFVSAWDIGAISSLSEALGLDAETAAAYATE